MTYHGPIACQHNHKKSSALLSQNQYYSKPHTLPDKHGVSAKGNPPSENQQAPQVSQYKKNGNNTPLYNRRCCFMPAIDLKPGIFSQ